MGLCVARRSYLPFSPPLLHGQNLNHSHEDVDEVEFERNRLVHSVLLHLPALSHASVRQDLLDVVESEAAENDKSLQFPKSVT